MNVDPDEIPVYLAMLLAVVVLVWRGGEEEEVIDQQQLADAMGFADMGEALRYLCGEWSQEAVADLLGVAKPTVRAWMIQWGVPVRRKGCGRPGRKGVFKARLIKIGEAGVKGKSIKELADSLGCAPGTVCNYLQSWGWKTR